MAEAKQIIVVDDHFEMLEFLRSMLQLSNQDYVVLAVPSAEEGLMELRRGNFDLLITDVRLPGMSGFDLIKRVRRLGLELPVIMITAYASSEGRKEAADLGVFHYFQKPLDTDDVLTAVTRALYGELIVPPLAAATAVVEFNPTEELRKRLETLRVDTGALQLVLASITGQVLHSVGGAPTKIDQDKLAAIIARNISDSFLLAREIGSKEPFTLQYHAGARVELYCANIGEQYFLTMFFDAAARRGRIGTIWVFTQRAIKELQMMLAGAPAVRPLQMVPPPITKRAEPPASKPVDREPEKPVVQKPTPEPPKPVATIVEEPEEFELAPAENLPLNITIIGAGADTPAFTDEEAASLLGFDDWGEDSLDMNSGELAALLADVPTPTVDIDDQVDLDAFWDDALTFDQETTSTGLSLEEARQKGLLPPEISDLP